VKTNGGREQQRGRRQLVRRGAAQWATGVKVLWDWRRHLDFNLTSTQTFPQKKQIGEEKAQDVAAG
jgi:hypothetical protein